MADIERRQRVAVIINEWLNEMELPLTQENIRRWFDIKYRQLPKEAVIRWMYNELETKRG